MTNRVLALVAAALAAAAPALAGTYFAAVTTSEGPRGAGETSVSVRGWVEGAKSRVEIAESSSPALPLGRFLLTLDGGTTVFVVDPRERTFNRWDHSGVPELPTVITHGGNGAITSTVSSPRIEKLSEVDGGDVAGIPTRHLRFRTTYETTTKSMGLQQTTRTVVDEDLWVAPKLTDQAFGLWLSRGPSLTGDEEADKILATQRPSFQGYPLKRIAVATTTDKSGNKIVHKASTLVTQLIVGAMPANTFAMGSGYHEKSVTMAAAKPGEEQPASGAESVQEEQRYPFDRMVDTQSGAGEPSPQPEQPAAQPAQAQPGQAPGQPVLPPAGQPPLQPQPGQQPGAQPAAPEQPQPEPEPEPPYPFERMLGSSRP
jgi:hypothetical protein